MTTETKVANSCAVCGTPTHIGCEHTKQSAKTESQSKPELTRERLANMNSLEIEVTGDFALVLEALKQETGADLQPRADGYHLTIIGPTENNVLSNLDDTTLAELQQISAQIQRGEGVTLKGIGFIDGANSPYKMREVDKVKKTAFIELDIPALQEFRRKVELPKKDFHVTLGFVHIKPGTEEGDIHMQIVGQEPLKPGSPKMKDIIGPIPKKVDSRFAFVALPEISYGGLDGPEKKKKE